MRAWIESLNTALNWGIGVGLGVLALIFAIGSIRASYPTWRESHRNARRSSHDQWVDSIYKQECMDIDSQIAYPADPANGEDHRG